MNRGDYIVISGYENIKLIYEKILHTLDYKTEDIQEIDFTEFVSSTYDELIEKKYTGHEKFAINGLKISSSKIKWLILDTIFSNLYCEFVLMLQNLDEKTFGIRHEFFLTSMEFNENMDIELSQNSKERFRRRMQSNRLNLIKKVKIKSCDKNSFYSPVLIRAFKESLLIPRPNTDVLDISKNYADIFFSLMYTPDEEDLSDEYKISRETLRAHRIWKLTPYDENYILHMLLYVCENNYDGNQFVQMMLLEKLYGLHSIADLWKYCIDDYDEYAHILFYALSTMRRFGYCLLHQQLIDSITIKISDATGTKDVVDRFIYPICMDMMKKILKTVLKALDGYEDKQRIDIINKLKDVCDENSNIAFGDDVVEILMEIPFGTLTECIKGMNGLNITKDKSFDFFLQLLGIQKFEDEEGMKKYLKTLSSKSYKKQYYEEKYKSIDYKSLFDISFYDLTFTDKHTVSKYELNKILNPNSKPRKKY